jgi:general secretion pathway protein I
MINKGVLSVKNRSSGFTLLEILVALAVVAIALSAIVNEVSSNVKNASRLQDKTFAHWVAMNKITEWHTSGDWPSPGETHGDVQMADQEWHWSLKVSTTDDDDVRRMDIEVSSDEDATTPDATLIAYIGRPMK